MRFGQVRVGQMSLPEEGKWAPTPKTANILLGAEKYLVWSSNLVVELVKEACRNVFPSNGVKISTINLYFLIIFLSI